MGLRGGIAFALATVLAALDAAAKAEMPALPNAMHERSLAWAALSIVLVGVAVGLVVLPSRAVAGGAGMLAGGVVGNLLSALRHDLRVPNPFVVGEVAFNLADVFVLAGLAALVLALARLSIRHRSSLLPPRRWEQALLERLSG